MNCKFCEKPETECSCDPTVKAVKASGKALSGEIKKVSDATDKLSGRVDDLGKKAGDSTKAITGRVEGLEKAAKEEKDKPDPNHVDKGQLVVFSKTDRTPAEDRRMVYASRVKELAHTVTKGDFARFLLALKNNDTATLKVLGTSPDADGGHLVPPDHLRAAIAEIAEMHGISLRLATIIPMGLSQEMDVPKMSVQPAAAWTAEAAEAVDAGTKFANVTLNAKKLFFRERVNNELIQDASPTVDSILIERFARARAKKIDDAVFNGQGSGASDPHTGILKDAGVLSRAAAGTSLAYDDLVEQEGDLTPGAMMGSWLYVNVKGRRALRLVKDADGRPLWLQEQGIIGQAPPATVLGYPVGLLSSTDAIPNNLGVGNDETVFILGNLQNVYIGMRDAFAMKSSDQVRFEFDQTVFVGIERIAVTVVNPEGFVKLTGIKA